MSSGACEEGGPTAASADDGSQRGTGRRRRWVLVLGVLGLGIVAVLVGRAVWPPRQTVAVMLPDVPLDGVDPSIAEAVTRELDAVAAEPENGDAWGRLGMVLYAHELVLEAVDSFTEATLLDPGDFRWPYLRGMVLGEVDLAEGLPYIRQALNLEPGNVFLRLRLAEFLLDLRELEESEQIFRQVLQLARDHPRAQLGLARLSAMRGDDQAAIKLASQAVIGAPGIRPVHELLAQLYHRNGNAKAATAQLQIAQKIPSERLVWPDPILAEVILLCADTTWQNEQAHQFLMQGRPDEYIKALQDMIRKYPERPTLYLQLTRTLLKMGNIAAARSVMQDAVRRNPDAVEVRYLWGVVHSNQQEYEKAAEIFRDVVTRKADYPEAHFSLAKCQQELGDTAGAIESLRQVLQYEPFFVDAHLELAELLLEKGQREEAIEHLKTALEISPDHGGALRLLRSMKTSKQSQPLP